jgi:hypothetical protein
LILDAIYHSETQAFAAAMTGVWWLRLYHQKSLWSFIYRAIPAIRTAAPVTLMPHLASTEPNYGATVG